MTITRASKNLIKDIRALRLKKRRDETGTYLAEGISVVLRALEAGAPVLSLIYSPELLRSEAAYQAIASAAGRLPCLEADPDLFASISNRDNPTGMAAVIAYHDLQPRDIVVGSDSVYVALDAIKSPGNLGTILRTADGLGFAGVILIGEATDQYHPECVKASMGTVFSVPVTRFPSTAEFLGWCSDRGLSLITTSCRARDDVTTIAAYPRPAALLMGAEATGLEGDTLQVGRLQVRIPMHGTASSLNLAVATAILMYDIISKPAQQPLD
ncbi:MAG: TrmH family RNA methyltransferase [Chloroflexota bacterium]